MKLILFPFILFLSFISIELRASSHSLKKNPKIVVIGAGLSGLTAAYRLHEIGFDVHVYEAKKRVGGRIFTVNVQNKIAELGAQNILNGGAAKNVLKLVNELGLKLINRKIDFTMYYYQNNALLSALDLLKDQQFNSEELKYLIQEIAQTSKSMQEVLLKLFDAAHPLYKMLSVTLTAYEGGSLERLSSLYHETLYHMLTGGLCSAQPGSEEKNELDILSIEGGNSVLTERLAEKINITTNTPLQSLSKNEENSYVLLFKNGKQVKADILILAIPCSVYKDIHFENEVIEENRLFDIMNVPYGLIAKLVVPIESKPLRRGVFITEQAFTFSATDPQILNLYLLDKASFFSAKSISKNYHNHIRLLEIGFGLNNLFLSSPVTAKDQSMAFYEGPVGHSWSSDPFIKGSFSYIGSGQEKIMTETSIVDGEIVKTLFSPINQSLYFVGEHTSIMSDIPGTMEAACESGERIARIISSVYSK